MDMTRPADAPLVLEHRRRLTIFCFLLTALFMATLDNQIVSTALPTIVGEFGELERFGWVGSAYLLASSASMPIYGKLGDLFGRKYVMLAAIVLFTIGSLTCGLAWSMDSLIASRVLQGLGGGGILVSIFSINADLFEPRERAKYQSYSSLAIMASGGLGPLLGGTMSELFGWRSIFLINLPIGIVAVTGILLMLPYRRPVRRPKIDYPGAILIAATVASLVMWADSVTLFGSLIAWQSMAVVAVGILCAVLWVLVEARVPEPVVPLKLFRDSTFTLCLVIALCSGAVAIGMVNYFALFLQTTTGLSPTIASLCFLATTSGIVIGSITTGRLIAITGRYKPFTVLGLALNILSLLIFSQLPVGTPIPVLLCFMLMQGLAIGFGQQAPIIGVQNSAPHEDVGAATGAVTLMRMAGASVAISVYGAIVAAGIRGAGAGNASPIPGVSDIGSLTPAMIMALPQASQIAVHNLYSHAFTPVFLTASVIAAIGLVAACLLKPVRLPKHLAEDKPQPTPE